MQLEETQKALDKFIDRVVIDSKKNLKKRNKVASSRLINSVQGEAKVFKNSFEASFSMEEYGEFVDAGVKGVGGTKADGTKWKLKKVTGSRFKYKNKKPPIQAFNGWTIRKGIAPRSKGGQFTKRRSLLFAIATSVFHTGIETTKFFTQPFDKEFKKLPDELVEAYALDQEDLLKFALK